MISRCGTSHDAKYHANMRNSLQLWDAFRFWPSAGILGENVPIPPVITQTVGQFWIVNISTLAVCLVVFTAL
jgi:hypothetical protein